MSWRIDGERLQKARREGKLTQADLADAVGVTRQMVSHWENGQRRMKTPMLFAVAHEIGLSVESLLGVEALAITDHVEIALGFEFAMMESLLQAGAGAAEEDPQPLLAALNALGPERGGDLLKLLFHASAEYLRQDPKNLLHAPMWGHREVDVSVELPSGELRWTRTSLERVPSVLYETRARHIRIVEHKAGNLDEWSSERSGCKRRDKP